jgi:hypothetical protein
MTTSVQSLLIHADDVRITQLLHDWHEAGRASFERSAPNLTYDTYAPKRAIQRQKYILLDEGTSGAFILDRTSGLIVRLKSKYGVPNPQKPCGQLGVVTGEQLARWRWW